MSRISLTGAIALSAVLVISLPANAQTGQKPKPAVGGKPLVQAKPTAPAGCKLVGTVRGTKLWAGDCVASGPAAAPLAGPGEKPSADQPEGAAPRGAQQ